MLSIFQAGYTLDLHNHPSLSLLFLAAFCTNAGSFGLYIYINIYIYIHIWPGVLVLVWDMI